MDKEKKQKEIKQTERLFELLKKKGTLRGFDDRKKNVVKTFEVKTPEEIIAEHTKNKEEKIPTVQELVERKKQDLKK